jgi:homeodomain-containing protein/DDE superfamily endonuclease
MPTPCAPRIILDQNARADLQAFIRAHSTPQSLTLRAHIVLRAADFAHPPTLKISRDLGCDNRTTGKWRRRYLDRGLAGVQDAIRPGRPSTIGSPTRVHVLSVASAVPPDQERTGTRWTLDEIVATLLDALPTDAISRSSIWRILPDVDRKPHKSADWLQSHDEPCDAKAHTICPLDATALESYQPGRVIICCDEKTGRQVLERKAPTNPAQPGRRERRDQADIRHGPRVLIHALAVATGQRAWTIGTTRTATDCVAHLKQAYEKWPRMKRYAWVMDNFHTPGSLDVCRLVARWCKVPCAPQKLKKGTQRRALLRDPSHRHVLHCTPKHGSWLHPAEWFLGVVPRRFLARGSCISAKDFARRLERFLKDSKARHAHPSRWTSTGEPFVRDTPFSRTRRQQRQGRAYFSPRPKRFERLLSSPRPSHRQAAA